MAHSVIDPAIFYWGTPAILVTTQNEDGTTNIAPMSSAFWLSNRCMMGLLIGSQTPINLERTGECVLNLPSEDMTDAVNALAKTTGTPVLSEWKQKSGYRYVKDKFEVANLTPQTSELVSPPRIEECPVQMEVRLRGKYPMGSGITMVFEVEVVRTYVTEDLRLPGHQNRINPETWRPLIISFQEMYGLSRKQVNKSKLAEIDEEFYRPPKAA